MSGNHTPGRKFYLVDIWAEILHPPAHTQASFKSCLYNEGCSLWLIPINPQ